ncbi:ABC transporter permease [Parafrankia soli]|uniref:ABC transporter permease n=1 Tax=Parafrankia soli TaxID=2599596 RepID=A0A1S1Q3D4_9ACTN|nr:ABC transporter permease [Parafrankia soli]OHV28077.1 ABC transporter permease [Parafrankia soli]
MAALREHVSLTVSAVGYGMLIAAPLVLAARRRPALAAWISGATSALYTVPSLAFFAILLPFTGLSRTSVLIGLVAYTLVILFRGFLTGLGSVPPEVRAAAVGMGHGGLGDLIYDGLGSTFRAEVLTASVLCVALAVTADLLFVAAQWLLTPWRHGAHTAHGAHRTHGPHGPHGTRGG